MQINAPCKLIFLFGLSVEATAARFDSHTSICDATSGERSAAAKEFYYEKARGARAEPESKRQ